MGIKSRLCSLGGCAALVPAHTQAVIYHTYPEGDIGGSETLIAEYFCSPEHKSRFEQVHFLDTFKAIHLTRDLARAERRRLEQLDGETREWAVRNVKTILGYLVGGGARITITIGSGIEIGKERLNRIPGVRVRVKDLPPP